jgi:hypothetical protein
MLRAISTVSDYLGAFAWASLPAAASWAGYRARVTDAGVNLDVISDGTRWAPFGVQVLARSAVAVAAPSDTTEDTLATIAVPAGLLGINGSIEIVARWTFTNSANNKTLRHRWSGGAGTIILGVVPSPSTATTTRTLVANRGAANSQYTQGDGMTGVSAVNSAAVDTTAATSIVITGQKALNTETLQLESYTATVYP